MNSEVRKRFNKWREENYYPELKVVAKELNVNYQHFTKWVKGSINYSESYLNKIDLFLKSKNY
ncbi:hypothetical protein [Enterococcus sp.]|uniref:hypothetical protein n=1 Tax=Enterococcus TaxID=1350 RepID=UPI001BD81290|nr:hypothetical protein [Enterococcus sp.]MBR8698935.1 hypothetical protein [Enterococcus gallinarum]